jgi:hypothetical protein
MARSLISSTKSLYFWPDGVKSSLLLLLELSVSLTCIVDFLETDTVQPLSRCNPPHDVSNVNRDHIRQASRSAALSNFFEHYGVSMFDDHVMLLLLLLLLLLTWKHLSAAEFQPNF